MNGMESRNQPANEDRGKKQPSSVYKQFTKQNQYKREHEMNREHRQTETKR